MNFVRQSSHLIIFPFLCSLFEVSGEVVHWSQEASLNVDSATDDAPGTKFITSQGPLHRAVEGV